ncbi:MAG TPA: hypothetical protein VGH45_05725 [Solirubrobacteraceae bacterium]|jgi:hypothetical protein
MAQEDHERLADELAKEGDQLENRSGELESQIQEARSEWRSKQEDPGVPGAIKPERAEPDAADDSESGAESESDSGEDEGQGNDDDGAAGESADS